MSANPQVNKGQQQISHSQFSLAIKRLQEFVYFDFFGPRIIPLRYGINLFKGATFLWILFLIKYFNNYSMGMYLYLALHGSYGIFWLSKDIFCPDAVFKQKASIGSYFLMTTLLVLYWVMPVFIAAGYGIQQPSQRRIMFCLTIYIIGLILMLGADIQKNTTLAKKKGLISTGFFSRTRNPNYLGQIFIYGSFAACTGYWISYAIVIFAWTTLFAVNMYVKEQFSYKLKQGWQEYKQKSFVLLPKLFKSNVINFALYIALVLIIYNYYQDCCDGHDHDHHHDYDGFHPHHHMPEQHHHL